MEFLWFYVKNSFSFSCTLILSANFFQFREPITSLKVYVFSWNTSMRELMLSSIKILFLMDFENSNHVV